MGTLLRLAIVLLGVWLVLRLVKRTLLKDDRPSSPAATPPADMLRCDYCGVFVPRSEATMAHGKPYCSDGHAEAASKKT
jgi:uncharacterized protein